MSIGPPVSTFELYWSVKNFLSNLLTEALSAFQHHQWDYLLLTLLDLHLSVLGSYITISDSESWYHLLKKLYFSKLHMTEIYQEVLVIWVFLPCSWEDQPSDLACRAFQNSTDVKTFPVHLICKIIPLITRKGIYSLYMPTLDPLVIYLYWIYHQTQHHS